MNKSLSLISVADTKLKETINALKLSKTKIKASKVSLITSMKVDKKFLFNGLEIIKVKPINSFKAYNHFIIYELFKYVNTSHIILIQWDGFIINPDKWYNNFMNYDYIGAPFIPRAKDKKYSRNINGNFYTIGNGGFSLRSYELLKSPTKFMLKDNKLITNNHEDGFYCNLHREFLESKGYKWAPYNLAINFAIESPLTLKDFYNLPFGFHGKRMLLIYKLTIFLRISFLKNLVTRFKNIIYSNN